MSDRRGETSNLYWDVKVVMLRGNSLEVLTTGGHGLKDKQNLVTQEVSRKSSQQNRFVLTTIQCWKNSKPVDSCGQRGLKEEYVQCSTLCDPMDCSLPGSSVLGISHQEYYSGLPFTSPGDLLDPGIEPASPALANRFFTTGKPSWSCSGDQIKESWRETSLVGQWFRICLPKHGTQV